MTVLTRNLLIAITVSLCFATCQQNEEIIEPESPSSIVEEIDLNNNPHLQGLVQGLRNQATSNGRTNSLLDNVDFSQASKYYDSANQVTKYTFSVNNNDDYTLRNFILMQPDNGEVFGLIFTHQLDLDWYSQFDAFPGWDQFTGIFSIQDIEGNFISESSIENGKSIDESNENGRTSGTTCVTKYILHQKDWYVNGVYDWTEYWITTETSCYATGGGAGSSADSPNINLDPNSDVVRSKADDFPPLDNYSDWEIDQTFGALCDNIDFLYSAQSFKAEIISLGGTWYNSDINYAVNVELGVNCVDIPEYYISTSNDAALGFANIFNHARTQIERELELGTLQPNAIAIRNRLISIISVNLNNQYPGSTFGLGQCQGDVPRTTADYGC